MSQTPIILMTAIAWGLLVVVMAVQGVLLVFLIRENRRLTQHASVHERITSIVANLAGLRKEHLALDELVSQWMNRSAVRAKRANKKEKEEQEEPEPPERPMHEDLFFPSEIL